MNIAADEERNAYGRGMAACTLFFLAIAMFSASTTIALSNINMVNVKECTEGAPFIYQSKVYQCTERK